ncbi:MAG: hypothetical protein U0Q18_07695 [Bryobacteraceae bacterium]
MKSLPCFCAAGALLAAALLPAAELKVQITAPSAIRVEPASPGVEIQDTVRNADTTNFRLLYPDGEDRRLQNLQIIWADLIANSDPDTARRLGQDAAFHPDSPRFTVLLNSEGTRGFSVTVDQLREQKAMWVPSLRVYLTAGESPVPFHKHLEELSAYKGQRILDRVHAEPEATYEQYKSRWEDMGSPAYVHPNQPAPGHIVGLTWDSAIAKFGIDRGAGVRNDYGNPDHFEFWYGFGDLTHGILDSWKSQHLSDGLPVMTTVFEKDGARYEVEQFAYPLNGPPSERRGDIPMVLMQKVRVTDLEGKARKVPVTMSQRRQFPAWLKASYIAEKKGNGVMFRDSAYRQVVMGVEGVDPEVEWGGVNDNQRDQKRLNATVFVDLPANGSREFIVKLPSPVVKPEDTAAFESINYESARAATLNFWSGWVERGAQFRVPEKSVNDLFRATLWHGLRLPRRHGGAGDNIPIDLPYSNFAYSQTGTPWPVNQAVYVDYMLYDLRGYHAVSTEELLAQYRSNQEYTGHVNGFANWLAYTPGMLYAVAQNYLLSHDRQALDRLMPQSMKALDWCLDEIRRSNGGLVAGPLNDGTGDGSWAFNQAYLYAGLERFGRILQEIGNPRAQEALDAAKTLRAAIAKSFTAASVHSALVQLRDHTWIPYVPAEALTYHRILDQWYPTDVDTGAVHMLRLKALPADGELAESLLNDHEDNLFLKGLGVANEPVYNQQATAYLLRDDAKAVIRAFYSYMASAFSHSDFEPVEHRWTWGQYFGPPSTDGAWFELYRNMLIREVDDGTLLLAQATPRKWLADGEKIEVRDAPTYFGKLTYNIESQAKTGKILANVTLTGQSSPQTLLVRLRHPEGKLISAVTVNGKQWTDFDRDKEWVRIPSPGVQHYAIVATY